MGLKRVVIIFFIIFQGQFAFSQWHQLPDISVPNVGSHSGHVLPQEIVPLSNGKIIYSMYVTVTPSGNKFVNLYFSNYDLSDQYCAACSAVFSGFPTYGNCGLGGIIAFNDSTLSYVYNISGSQFQSSTNNNFKNLISRQYPDASTSIGSHYSTANYFYALVKKSVSSLPFGDTLTLVRTSFISNTNHIYIKLPLYQKNIGAYPETDKLMFSNDSTGFSLVSYRNNINKSTLIKTVNYGNTWSELMLDSINRINNFTFPSLSVGYITKLDGSIHKTINGGTNWSQLISPTTSTINSIKFETDLLGYIAGNNGQLWKTIDGGANWLSEVSTTTLNINAVYTFSNVAYFVTASNQVYKNAPDVIGLKELKDEQSVFIVYPNPSDDRITIDLSAIKEKVSSIKIINVMGEIVKQKLINETSNASNHSLSVRELSSGTYFVVIESRDRVLRKKISVIK